MLERVQSIRNNSGFQKLKESVPVAGKPKNYLALQRAYQALVPVGSTKEIGAAFLTDQKRQIALVYAACGNETSVVIPFQDEVGLGDLFMNYRLNTLVTFHNHPHRSSPVFSATDIEIHRDRIYAINMFRERNSTSRTLFLYDAVESSWRDYEWIGYSTKVGSPRAFRYLSELELNKGIQGLRSLLSKS